MATRRTRRAFLGLVGRATAAVAETPMAITALAQKAPQAAQRVTSTASSVSIAVDEAEAFIPQLWSQQALRAVEFNTVFSRVITKAIDADLEGIALKIPKLGGL